MPYLKTEDRARLDPHIGVLACRMRDFGAGFRDDLVDVIKSMIGSQFYVDEMRPELFDPSMALRAAMKPMGGGFGGDVNYALHRIVALAHPRCYAHWEEAIGAMAEGWHCVSGCHHLADAVECAKLEMYCVRVRAYEEPKRLEGDVF